MTTQTASLNLIQRLAALESAVVADVMVAMGLHQQILSPDLLPLPREGGLAKRIAGPAICAEGRENAGDDALPTFGLDQSIYPGGIVIINTNNCRKGAIIGDNMATSMKNNGAIGFITDGGIRDAEEFMHEDLPVFHGYRTPINAHKYWSFTSFEQPIKMPGIWGEVSINPGDLIIADGDGVAVLPQQHAELIIEHSEKHLKTENSIKEGLLAGGDRETVSKENPRLSHVSPLNN